MTLKECAAQYNKETGKDFFKDLKEVLDKLEEVYPQKKGIETFFKFFDLALKAKNNEINEFEHTELEEFFEKVIKHRKDIACAA